MNTTAFFLVLLSFSLAWAQPQEPQVVHGDARFSQDQAVYAIETGDRCLLEWKSFSIAPGETVRFLQPSSASAVLNRVTGSLSSEIFGTLQATGKVYLINPNGIVIGPEGVVQTAGFLASTLDVSNDDFLHADTLLFRGDSQAEVVNLGKISASSGDVILLGARVRNAGSLEAPFGTVGLAVAQEVLLHERGDTRLVLHLQPSTEQVEKWGLSSEGTIQALQTELKADGNLYKFAIQHRGTIEASHIAASDGRIYLVAEEGIVEVAGKVHAPHGTIHILGEQVALLEGTDIDVSGMQGGGTVLVGGDYQGKNPRILNSKMTFVSPATSIRADALQEGDGGRLIFWSDGATYFYGSASVRGGAEGGNGGFVEVSGKGLLDFQQAIVDRLAPKGEAGDLLLDPSFDMTISAAASASVTPVPPYITFTFLIEPTANLANLDVVDLLAAISFGNVTVQTVSGAGGTGTLTVATPVTIPWPYSLTLDTFSGTDPGDTADIVVTAGSTITNRGHGDLTFNARRHITLDAGIVQFLTGTTSLKAGREPATLGAITISATAPISSVAGDIIMTSPTTISISALQTASNMGLYSLTATDSITLTSAGTIISATGIRDVVLTAGNLITVDGDISFEHGDISMTTTNGIGDISILDNITTTGLGTISLDAGQDVLIGPAATATTIQTAIGAITMDARDIVVTGGTAGGATTTITTIASGPVTLDATRNIDINGGTAAASITTLSGPISLDATNLVSLDGSGAVGGSAAVASTSGPITVEGLNITLTGGGAAGTGVSISSANTVDITATQSITLDGGAVPLSALISSGNQGLTVTAGIDVTMSNSADLLVSAHYAPLSVFAGNDLNLSSASEISNDGSGELTIVVDTAAGGGGINTAVGTDISTAGGALRIFTDSFADNAVLGSIQGMAAPGLIGCSPPSANEQCGTAYPSTAGGTPFTVFYIQGTAPPAPPACTGCGCTGCPCAGCP